MPVYDIYCNCGYEEEAYLKLDQETPKCPKCGQQMKKIMSAPTFILNGHGWAKDNYGLKENKNAKK